jgi:hypothetical protein
MKPSPGERRDRIYVEPPKITNPRSRKHGGNFFQSRLSQPVF